MMTEILRKHGAVIGLILGVSLLLSAIGAGEGWAVDPAAPLVQTNGSLNETPTSATLKGDYWPYKYQVTESYFEYGPSPLYGTTSQQYAVCKYVPSGQVCEVSGQVTNLIPQQVYHFRLVAKYWSEANKKYQLSVGEDRQFATFYPATVTTGAATDLSSTSVVLHGQANPNGNKTYARFEYSVLCFMNCPPPLAAGQDVGSVNTPVEISIKVTGLTPGKKYNYRLRAKNDGGDASGEYKNFFTPSKPIVETLAATNIGTRDATLNGWVTPAALDTMYYFEFGETEGYGIKKSQVYAGKGVDLVSASMPLPNHFSPGKTYHFRIAASNSLGISYGEDKTFMTPKLQPPSAVTGNATSVTISTATLNGMMNPHNDQAMWHFEYRKGRAAWTKTDDAGAAVENDWNVTANIWGLDSDTTYTYRIVAKNGGGTVTGEDKTFKTAPLSLATAATGEAQNVSKISARLTGTVNPNGVPTSYWFWYGKSKSYTTHTPGHISIQGTDSIAVSEDITGLTPNTTYYYKISANNIKGNVDGEDKSFATSAVPQEAATGNASNVTSNGATLAGTITPNGLSITWWFNYGKTANYGQQTSGMQEASVTGTLFFSRNIAGLTPGTIYHYRIASQTTAGVVYGTDKTFTTAK
jgi:phosphodiesterase/alkaline phosphatase D-like protein